MPNIHRSNMVQIDLDVTPDCWREQRPAMKAILAAFVVGMLDRSHPPVEARITFSRLVVKLAVDRDEPTIARLQEYGEKIRAEVELVAQKGCPEGSRWHGNHRWLDDHGECRSCLDMLDVVFNEKMAHALGQIASMIHAPVDCSLVDGVPKVLVEVLRTRDEVQEGLKHVLKLVTAQRDELDATVGALNEAVHQLVPSEDRIEGEAPVDCAIRSLKEHAELKAKLSMRKEHDFSPHAPAAGTIHITAELKDCDPEKVSKAFAADLAARSRDVSLETLVDCDVSGGAFSLSEAFGQGSAIRDYQNDRKPIHLRARHSVGPAKEFLVLIDLVRSGAAVIYQRSALQPRAVRVYRHQVRDLRAMEVSHCRGDEMVIAGLPAEVVEAPNPTPVGQLDVIFLPPCRVDPTVRSI